MIFRGVIKIEDIQDRGSFFVVSFSSTIESKSLYRYRTMYNEDCSKCVQIDDYSWAKSKVYVKKRDLLKEKTKLKIGDIYFTRNSRLEDRRKKYLKKQENPIYRLKQLFKTNKND